MRGAADWSAAYEQQKKTNEFQRSKKKPSRLYY
jgi:hypothetical protein